MMVFRSLFSLAFLFLLPVLVRSGGEEVLVLVNSRIPESLRLGRLYQELRGIPPSHVLALPFSNAKEISHGEFDRTVRPRIQKWMGTHGNPQWQELPMLEGGRRVLSREIRSSSIRYVVSTWGVPYGVGDSKGNVLRKLERTQQPLGDQRDQASFDSEVSLACWKAYPREGGISNPILQTRPGAAHVLMATRLDGPSPALVELRLREGLQAEAHGVKGSAVVDAQGISKGGYAMGDRWLMNSAQQFQTRGLAYVLDQEPTVLSTDTVLPATGVSLYLGWYSQHPEGLFLRDDWTFSTGAIAVHLHSFAGHRPRDADRFWLGPLMKRGAVAGFGSLHEPYLHGVPRLDSFTRLLLEGRSYGEAVYGSMPLLSWQTVVLGDPLYRWKPRSDDGS